VNTGSTLGTAILRGFFNFICTTLVAGITAYLGFSSLIDDSAQAVGNISDRDIVVYSVLTGLLAGLGALGFRAGVEGQYDARRSANVDMKPSDVGWTPPHPTP
jgi:hypothetical protein